ncbi:hypothetical protein [Clostridium butyricum]|uniref:hypothetical protein n=1 Tax=Clostridium butyricum TaxID=1492 RepID=UPI00210735D8|nr:hypothetical protein [Clostridium butyricum]MCQ2015093.1 hypothetical protein [Clostridium butyricum]MCQ2026881.1 hypothetical protein [Clostridium butyricum]
MRIETEFNTYLRLKKGIGNLIPDINVNLIIKDTALYKLGFSKEIMCTIDIEATDDQIEELRDICYQFEIDAFNTLDGSARAVTDPDYIKYEKYTWIADWIFSVLG